MTSEVSSPAHRFAAALASVPELAAVERLIADTFETDVPLLQEIPRYLLNLGGKRIRPALVLLCAKALGQREITPQLIDIASGIELIHMATLLHDDIIDHSPVRRHQPSPLAKFGVASTLLSGDFLLTRAFGLCARLDKTVIGATERACIALVEGEILETPLYAQQHSLASSLTIARRKTASLFDLAAFCAGHLCNVPPAAAALLREFGELLGIAFQILDDILDVTSDEATLGKKPGLDIVERKPSVVNILWLESGDPAAQRLLSEQGPDADEESAFVRASLAKLVGSEVIQKARTLAFQYAETARERLHEGLSLVENTDSQGVDYLDAVLDFAIDRAK